MSQRQPHDEAVDSVTFTAPRFLGAGQPAVFLCARMGFLLPEKAQDGERRGRMSVSRSDQRLFGSKRKLTLLSASAANRAFSIFAHSYAPLRYHLDRC
jgi:hypothetical protein